MNEISGGAGNRTRGENTQETLENKVDREHEGAGVSPRLATVRDAARPVETATGAHGDPVEQALAEGVRALAGAMRSAHADSLPVLAERMAVVAAELARRGARDAREPAQVIALERRWKR